MIAEFFGLAPAPRRLVAFAGLPGTGKTTLATAVAAAVGGVVLSKDTARAALFPPAVLDYSRTQDDIAMSAVYAAAGHLLRTRPRVTVFIDGRTFTRKSQVEDLLSFAAGLRLTPGVVECVCPDDEAEARIAADLAAGTHPAGNRTVDLYRDVEERADPLTVPRLTLDTAATPVADCVRRVVEYLTGRPTPAPAR